MPSQLVILREHLSCLVSASVLGSLVSGVWPKGSYVVSSRACQSKLKDILWRVQGWAYCVIFFFRLFLMVLVLV